jgi:hypothetical protein
MVVVPAPSRRLIAVAQAPRGIGESHHRAAMQDGRARAELVAHQHLGDHAIGGGADQANPEELRERQGFLIQFFQRIHKDLLADRSSTNS